MGRWAYGLGGLFAWGLHFVGIYAFASLDAQTPADDRRLWQLAAVLLSLACAGACAGLAALALRRMKARREAAPALMDQFAALGAAAGLVGVAWQALAALIV